MPTQKIDPKVIFASNAPTIDTPPIFSDKTKGWDVARANDGRPTIKEMNKVQQDTDLKILWLNENSVTPYDVSIDYPDGAVAIKDGSFKQLASGAWVEFLDDFADKEEVNAALLAKTDKTYVDGQLVLKADKVEVDKFYPTLTQANADIANIAVNQPVNISESQNFGLWYKATAGATTLTKSAYDPLIQAKNYVSNTGGASIVGVLQSNINYVTTTRTLEFKNAINVVTGTDTYLLATPQSVDLPLNTPSRLEYVVSSGSVVLVARNASRLEGNLVIGFVTATEATLKTLDFAFTVDGIVQNPPHIGKLVTDTATRINFNNATATLELGAEIRVKTNYTTTDLSAFTLAQRTIAYPTLTGFYTLQYDLTTQAFSFRLNSVLQPLNTADIAVVKFVNSAVTDVWGIDVYAINGEQFVQFREGIQIGNLIPVSKSDINFDFVNKQLKIVANRVRLVSSTATPIVLPAVTLDISGDEGSLKRVLYNTKTATFRTVRANTSTSNDEVQVALFHLNDKFVGDVPYYSINGVAADGSSSGASNTGKLLGQSATDINFDFVAETLTIADQKVRFLRNGKTSLLAGQVLDISTTASGNWSSIVVTAENALAIRPVSLPNVAGDIVVGQLRVKDQQVQDIPYFSIQRKASKPSSQLKTADFLVPFGNVEPDYSQPELPSYDALWSENIGDYTKFYALYDALMAAHPAYITKTTLGNDALGNPIHQYQFSTPEVGTVNASSKKAKVILFSGIHGGEKAGMYNVYFALKEITERWKQDSHLEALHWGVNFIVLPVVNPTGYNLNSRLNHNTVDLARNFTADWSATQPNSGAAPLDQAESVIMDAVMSNNTDALYLCSHHNFGDNTTNFIWNASATWFSRSLSKNLIIGQTIRAKKRYSWMSQTDDYYIGWSDLEQPLGSEGRQAVDKYGINSSTFEISSSFAWEAGMPKFSSVVATIGVETFINWLLMNVKYAPQLYNTRINL